MKKVVYLSNFSKQKTGFARHARTILSELYKTGNYDLVEIACGITMSHPALKSVPWKCIGTVPDDPAEYSHIENNPHLKELMFFGAMTIDKIIKQEKPDAIIMVEDIWKIAWAFHKPWFNKIPTLIHTPIDSSPVLPLIKQNAPILKNLWVKADFAVKDLEKIGIKSKSVPLLTDQSYFHPLSPERRQELRKTFNLEDQFVIGFVFRNQLRKLVVSLLRGFKEFKTKNPEAKAKLLLHTNFDEAGNGGWNIIEAANNLGVDIKDILCTYVCFNCKAVQVIPYSGSQLTCGRCGQHAVKNPNIEFGITDEELNAVYNLMDFYCHPATSGGFEGPMAEASLVGLPTATCNYSFGEMFCSAHAIPIKHTIVDELQSMFEKSQPVDGAICNVIEEVYNNKDKYKKVGADSRAWALKKFDLKTNIQYFKDWIDQAESVFDYNFFDVKNVDYPPDFSLDGKDFITDLYSGVFGIFVTSDNPDVSKYIDMLKFNSKELVAKEIKEVARKMNLQQKPGMVQDFLLKTENEKIAIVCSGTPIECFNLLGFIKPLVEKHSGAEIYIIANEESQYLFDQFQFANFIPFRPEMKDWKNLTGAGTWEGIFDKCYIMPDIEYDKQ